MGRKSYRQGTPASQAKQPAPVRRYRPRAARRPPRAKSTPVGEGQYEHVRQELLRIGLLALALFTSLIVLRIVTLAFSLLP
jgi:hypothetical protein